MEAPFIGKPELNRALPLNNMHAISVSLPHWRDSIDFRKGEARVWDTLNVGYPRFMLHGRVLQLGRVCLKKLGLDATIYNCLPMVTLDQAEQARRYTHRHKTLKHGSEAKVDKIQIHPCSFGNYTTYAVVYPKEDDEFVSVFMSTIGCGATSRFADACLKAAGVFEYDVAFEHNFDIAALPSNPLEGCLPEEQTSRAKQLIRQRIVDVIHNTYSDTSDTNAEFTRDHPSALALTEDNVYLYPGGMNSIYHLHRTLGFLKSELKTVCFGFPYTGAMKVLENIGSGCIFFGHGSEEEIDTLEKQLADPTNERVLSIFCEIPSNPLLKTPNIRRLRALADQHDVPLLIDGTVGGFSNCQVFPYADVMVVSLTKSFSGASDVMGGCLIVNTSRPQGTRLQHALNVDDGSGHPGYKDTTWWEDVVVLERNSRTFKERDAQSNRTAEIISDYLHNHPKVARVYYPKYMCKDDYNSYKRPGGGYGNLLSFELYTEEAAQTFFNALSCAKGPSFGTNFSLAIPYTPIVHFDEMEWAKSYGLEAYLIRFGVGLESADQLREWFDDAFAVVPATPSAV